MNNSPKKYTQFLGYALFFCTNHSILANIGPRVDFAPSEDSENGHLLNKKVAGVNSKEQYLKYFRYVLTSLS